MHCKHKQNCTSVRMIGPGYYDPPVGSTKTKSSLLSPNASRLKCQFLTLRTLRATLFKVAKTSLFSNTATPNHTHTRGVGRMLYARLSKNLRTLEHAHTHQRGPASTKEKGVTGARLLFDTVLCLHRHPPPFPLYIFFLPPTLCATFAWLGLFPPATPPRPPSPLPPVPKAQQSNKSLGR